MAFVCSLSHKGTSRGMIHSHHNFKSVHVKSLRLDQSHLLLLLICLIHIFHQNKVIEVIK